MLDLTLLQHAYPMADTIRHAIDMWSHTSKKKKNHLARKITNTKYINSAMSYKEVL